MRSGSGGITQREVAVEIHCQSTCARGLNSPAIRHLRPLPFDGTIGLAMSAIMRSIAGSPQRSSNGTHPRLQGYPTTYGYLGEALAYFRRDGMFLSGTRVLDTKYRCRKPARSVHARVCCPSDYTLWAYPWRFRDCPPLSPGMAVMGRYGVQPGTSGNVAAADRVKRLKTQRSLFALRGAHLMTRGGRNCYG